MAAQILADRYEAVKQLGQKPGRRTLLARDLQTQELVVIKLIALAQELEGDALKLFQREAETLKNLFHPAVPRYLDYFEVHSRNGEGLAMVQTYLRGKSLQEYLEAGQRFSEADAKGIAKAILRILVYLHSATPPIIHRDIKPSNILLSEISEKGIGQVFLVDFGSVKSFGDTSPSESQGFTVVGTYGYMPPEQFSGRAIVPSDLYSLGATLLTIMTGVHPSSLPQKGVRVDVDRIGGMSPDFATWLKQMTEPNLASRFTSAKDALQALEQEIQASPSPSVVQQPPDSKITLTRTGETAEITIPSTLGQTRLHIDSQTISMTKQMFGMKVSRPQTSRRHEITRLEHVRPMAAEGGNAAAEAWVVIRAGDQIYEIGGGQFSEAEVEWLAYELCDVLKLPINRY